MSTFDIEMPVSVNSIALSINWEICLDMMSGPSSWLKLCGQTFYEVTTWNLNWFHKFFFSVKLYNSYIKNRKLKIEIDIRNSNATSKILWPHLAKFNLRNWPSSFFTLFQTDKGKEEKWKFPGVNWRRLEVPLIRSTLLVFYDSLTIL